MQRQCSVTAAAAASALAAALARQHGGAAGALQVALRSLSTSAWVAAAPGAGAGGYARCQIKSACLAATGACSARARPRCKDTHGGSCTVQLSSGTRLQRSRSPGAAAARCSLHAARCMLHAARCMLYAARCMLHAACARLLQTSCGPGIAWGASGRGLGLWLPCCSGPWD